MNTSQIKAAVEVQKTLAFAAEDQLALQSQRYEAELRAASEVLARQAAAAAVYTITIRQMEAPLRQLNSAVSQLERVARQATKLGRFKLP